MATPSSMRGFVPLIIRPSDRVRSSVGCAQRSRKRRGAVLAAGRAFAGPSVVGRLAATALFACAIALVGAVPGWGRGAIRWHGCGPDSPPSLQCGELSAPLDYGRP